MARRIARFSEVYCIHFNATQAAIACGYSAKGAGTRALELLGRADVQEAIRERQAANRAQYRTEADRVIEELASCGLYDIGNLFTADGFLKPAAEIDERTRRAIVSVKVVARTERSSGQDQPVAEIISTEMKLADKVQSLVALGRHFGIFEKDNAQAGAADVRAILAACDPGKVDLRPHFRLANNEGAKPAPNGPSHGEEAQPQPGIRLLDRISDK